MGVKLVILFLCREWDLAGEEGSGACDLLGLGMCGRETELLEKVQSRRRFQKPGNLR